MSYIVVLLVFVVIGLMFYIEVKDIEIERLQSELISKEDIIFELTKEFNT